MSSTVNEWAVDSRRALRTHVTALAARLRALADSQTPPDDDPFDAVISDCALARLVAKFSLSRFERDLLVLTAGVEIDAELPALIAKLHGDARRTRPTLALALRGLAAGDWAALSPDGPLRRGRLLAIAEGPVLTSRPLSVEEPVIQYLLGLPVLDPLLSGAVDPLEAKLELTNGQQQAVTSLVEAWSRRDSGGRRSKTQLSGNSPGDARIVVEAASQQIGFKPYELDVARLHGSGPTVAEFAQLWERDAVLHDCTLLLDVDESAGPQVPSAASTLLHKLPGLVVVCCDKPLKANHSPLLRIEVERSSPDEQRTLWNHALGEDAAAVNGSVERIVDHFRLDPFEIRDAAFALRPRIATAPESAGQSLWDAARNVARGGLESLGQRIETHARWDDLVLPEPQRQMLRSLTMHVRSRSTVYERWGFAEKSSRGLGVSALFWGLSGAGKTMAAEAIAGELQLDLFRIDLSAAVSKYIGETEKNLRKIFDAAEASGAILLFDEADALFGKRSEVKDSHDRYANLEVSYLLQKMEAYRGLAILTTNIKGALDQAFLRRLRFVVQFPFPTAADRAEIWRRVFPERTPLGNLNFEKLSRLGITGGNISNIALDAAFRAADEGSHVEMKHLLAAARAEYSKLDKPLSDAEIRGWL